MQQEIHHLRLGRSNVPLLANRDEGLASNRRWERARQWHLISDSARTFAASRRACYHRRWPSLIRIICPADRGRVGEKSGKRMIGANSLTTPVGENDPGRSKRRQLSESLSLQIAAGGVTFNSSRCQNDICSSEHRIWPSRQKQPVFFQQHVEQRNSKWSEHRKVFGIKTK